MNTEFQTVITQILLYAVPLLLAALTGFVLVKVNNSGKGDKLQKAITVAESIIPILINLYKELCKHYPEMQDKATNITTWFKEYVTKIIPLTDEELNTLWKLCYSKIMDEFEKAGFIIDLKLECNFSAIDVHYRATQFRK